METRNRVKIIRMFLSENTKEETKSRKRRVLSTNCTSKDAHLKDILNENPEAHNLDKKEQRDKRAILLKTTNMVKSRKEGPLTTIKDKGNLTHLWTEKSPLLSKSHAAHDEPTEIQTNTVKSFLKIKLEEHSTS